MFVKVVDSTYIRDTNSGVLINQDYGSRDEYLAKVKMITEHKSDINNINKEITDLKTDISEIKSLLLNLVKNT